VPNGDVECAAHRRSISRKNLDALEWFSGLTIISKVLRFVQYTVLTTEPKI
jgi:hypothetical protein